jgi:hypothetical protein
MKMTDWKNHKELQAAVHEYVKRNNLHLARDAVYESSIDCVLVYVSNHPVLVVGLPPVSQYPVEETEYTDIYMREKRAVGA